MRFLANENMPGDAVSALRAAGMDVLWVRQDSPGLNDIDVLAWAVREKRILLTFDKDFGELAFRSHLPSVLSPNCLSVWGGRGRQFGDNKDTRNSWL